MPFWNWPLRLIFAAAGSLVTAILSPKGFKIPCNDVSRGFPRLDSALYRLCL